MGKTIIEKIMAVHSDEEVKPGAIVWIDLDIRSARDFGGANVVKNFTQEYSGEEVEDPNKTFFTFDCVAPANTIPYANNQQICRLFAREQGIKVFDVDKGIGTHVLMEQGLALPGSIVVGTDSHMNILGAVGSFGQGMGDQDIAFAFKTGKTWFEVPETIRVVLKGRYFHPTTARDLTLAVVRRLGSKGALGKAIEYYGEAVEKLDMAGRITLASMATEMGAIISFLPQEEEVRNFLRQRKFKKEGRFFQADSHADYCEEIEVHVQDLEPLISAPPVPENVHPVSSFKDVKVDSVFIGSCTNGRYEDFRMAADLLKGRKVAEGVMMKLVPATYEVFGQMLEEGLIEAFFKAGAIISHPSCGGCASGQLGMTGKGEVQVSTSNRNFRGKQGEGDTYLASPLTAAASALTGKITDPREVLS